MYEEMSNKALLNAEEVAKSLGVSKPYAYKLVKMLNDELEGKGFITIAGRVSAKYLEERFYGVESKTV